MHVAMQVSATPVVPTEPIESAVELAEAFGIDLSLGRENLRLNYTQRLLQHQEALNLVLAFEAAGQTLRERTDSTAAVPDRG